MWTQKQGEEPFFHKKKLEIDYFPDSNCHKHFVQLMQNDFCVFREEKYLTFFKEKIYMLFRLQCLFESELWTLISSVQKPKEQFLCNYTFRKAFLLETK